MYTLEKFDPEDCSLDIEGAITMPEHLTTNNADFEYLLSLGFSSTEAAGIAYMKNHVSEQGEYREMIEENRRLNFIRWLIEHDRLGN